MGAIYYLCEKTLISKSTEVFSINKRYKLINRSSSFLILENNQKHTHQVTYYTDVGGWANYFQEYSIALIFTKL